MAKTNAKAKTAKPRANGASKDPLAIFGFNEGASAKARARPSRPGPDAGRTPTAHFLDVGSLQRHGL